MGKMVGTGRIELPTSSVSRKRSPTELRAFNGCDKMCAIERKFTKFCWLHADGQSTTGRELTEVVQEFDFITNFSAPCQLSRVSEGALFCSQRKPRYKYCSPDTMVARLVNQIRPSSTAD